MSVRTSVAALAAMVAAGAALATVAHGAPIASEAPTSLPAARYDVVCQDGAWRQTIGVQAIEFLGRSGMGQRADAVGRIL